MKVKRPCGHRVTIKLKEVEEKTQSGIIISTGSDTRRRQLGVEEGTVVQIGETAFKAFDDGIPWCKVGDRVGFVQYSGLHYEDDEGTFRVVNDVDIVCILEGDSNE